MSSPPYSKRDVLRFLLEQGQPVRLLLDARREGVEVPPRFRNTPQLILEIGYKMNPPIPDLDIEGDGVRCTLSFAKQPFQCVMPWTAIWTLVGKHDGRGYQWVEDMPPEIVAIPQAPPAPAMGPRLRALHAVETTNDEGPSGEAADEAKADEARAEAGEPARVDEPRDAERSKTTEAEAPGEEKPAEKADDKPADKPEEKPEEDDEGGRPGGKKKRALPSYLRVIK